MGLSSAKSVGCKVEEISPFDVAKGKENEDLKLLSEILKVIFHILYELLIKNLGETSLESKFKRSSLFTQFEG